MSIKTHDDYPYEFSRLEETKTYLENVIFTLTQNREKIKEEIKDAYLHLDYLDSSLSYSSIMLNSSMLDDLEKNFELLLYSRKKPYFARIDIKQNENSKKESLYIGKVSLFDPEKDTPTVVDWRAPIASVYYDGRLGNTDYIVQNESISIELLLKRQYIIEDGKLTNFMDVDISSTDTFLQASLDNHASDKLKDIVSTIQAEQNAIIRASIDKPLIVQGVAGSGKTTIALHRIAYLIYTFSETFNPEHFMIIAPNNLFLDYISQVLPELGATRVKQTTYIDFMLALIGKKYKLLTDDKLSILLDSNDNDASHSLSTACAFKNSMSMKPIIDAYVSDILDNLLPKEDFYLYGTMLVKYDTIQNMLLSESKFIPIYSILEKIKKYLAKFAKDKSKAILIKTEAEFDKKLDKIRASEPISEERRLKIIDMIAQREAALELIKKDTKTIATKYINKVLKKDLFEYYFELMCDSQKIAHYDKNSHPDSLYEFIAENATLNLSKKQIEIEDLAPLVYLQKFLFEVKNPFDIRYGVIDEAQDFGEFQFFVLKTLLKTERFTILGDLSQGIHKYKAIKSWDGVINNVFDAETSYLCLEQSYRTTVEIMNLANTVLSHSKRDDIIFAKPVVRHGKTPQVTSFENSKDVISRISEEITNLKADKFTTIAIISKNSKEAKKLHSSLAKTLEHKLSLMDDKVIHYDNDIVVIPSHLAKGLEFDAVIVTAVEEHYDFTELDITLLYVAMTRPLHRLSVFYKEGCIPFFKNTGETNENTK